MNLNIFLYRIKDIFSLYQRCLHQRCLHQRSFRQPYIKEKINLTKKSGNRVIGQNLEKNGNYSSYHLYPLKNLQQAPAESIGGISNPEPAAQVCIEKEANLVEIS